MACGTGKTLVAQRIAEHKDITPKGGLVVYATPSILLTGQSQVSWLRNETDRPIASLVVCCDKKAGAGYEKWKSELAYDLLGSVTTTPEKIADEVRRLHKSVPENGLVVIFTTYQSMDKVIAAQRDHGLPHVDFAIADEAHWTAGKWSGDEGDRESSKYLMFHENLKSTRRMYQTATPRIYRLPAGSKMAKNTEKHAADLKKQKLVDMNSIEVFGGTMHTLSFRKALKKQVKGQERLCDYRIVIAADTSVGIPDFALTAEKPTKEEKDVFINTISEARLCAIMRSMTHLQDYNADDGSEHGLRSCIAFANRVHRAEGFAAKVNDSQMRKHVYGDEAVSLSAGHLDASSKANERMTELGRLAKANELQESRHITFNVKVLSEGVDVPALDAVAFIDERDSVIDIVQAVGRVMRRPPGSNKTTGYLVVPVGMGKWVEGEECMAESLAAQQWKILGQVLIALRAIEGPLFETDFIDRIVVDGKNGGSGNRIDQHEAAREFVKKLMGADFAGIAPHIMPNTGVMRGDLRAERKSIMQSMVGGGTLYLHDEGLGPQLMKCTNTDVSGNSKEAVDKASFRACQAAALHLTLCMLMHQRLVETRANQPPIAKLKSLSDCDVKTEIGGNLLEQWELVLAHDFKPVFAPGIAVLHALRDSTGDFPKGAVSAMREISDLATLHASKYADMGADEAGEIFQAAMDKDAQTIASAWYSVPVAGVLLAEMTCDAYAPKDDPIWKDPQYWREHAILDPACGSGTLLIAMMSAIIRRAQAQGASDSEIVTLRRALIEDSLTGLDINKWAIQLAATQMAISVGSAPLNRMGLYEMPQSNGSGQARLGSLELLLFNKDGSPRSLAEIDVKSKGMDMADVKGVMDSHEGLLDRMKRVDICIANPPFGTFEQAQKNMSASEKEGMKKRKDFIHGFFQFDAGKNPLKGASNSLSPWFTLLMTGLECRVMGKIAPQIALVSPVSDERNYIRNHYDMVNCVTSHEKAEPGWSSKSSINESMLVFIRKQDQSPDASFTGVSIRPALDDSTNWSAWTKSTFIARHGSDWWHSSFCNEGMHAAVDELVSTVFHDECWITVGELMKMKTLDLNDTTRTYYNRCVDVGTGHHSILKDTGDVHRTLALTPNAEIPRLDLDSVRLKKVTDKMSTLLHARTFDLRSGRLHAAHVSKSCLGVGWVPMANVSLDESKGLAVFLNSTIHRINLLMCFSKKLEYPCHTPKAIASTYVPNVWSNPNMLGPLLIAYERTSAMETHRFDAGYTEIRKIWDKAVADAISLGGGDIAYEKIKSWAEALAEEPLVRPSERQMQRQSTKARGM